MLFFIERERERERERLHEFVIKQAQHRACNNTEVFDYVKNIFFNKCGYSLLHHRVKVSNVMLLLGCRHNFVIFEILIFRHMGTFLGQRALFKYFSISPILWLGMSAHFTSCDTWWLESSTR